MGTWENPIRRQSAGPPAQSIRRSYLSMVEIIVGLAYAHKQAANRSEEVSPQAGTTDFGVSSHHPVAEVVSNAGAIWTRQGSECCPLLLATSGTLSGQRQGVYSQVQSRVPRQGPPLPPPPPDPNM